MPTRNFMFTTCRYITFSSLFNDKVDEIVLFEAILNVKGKNITFKMIVA